MSDNLNTIGIRGKIAARTPDYRYTLPEGGNPGDIPVKTETGVEWQQPEPATTTPDYLQNDETASDYIKNRPGGYTVDYPAINIEWDGVIGDRVAVEVGGAKYVKISDEVVPREHFIGATVEMLRNATTISGVIEDNFVDDYEKFLIVQECCLVCKEDNLVLNGIAFPEAGTYFIYLSNNNYVSKIFAEERQVMRKISSDCVEPTTAFFPATWSGDDALRIWSAWKSGATIRRGNDIAISASFNKDENILTCLFLDSDALELYESGNTKSYVTVAKLSSDAILNNIVKPNTTHYLVHKTVSNVDVGDIFRLQLVYHEDLDKIAAFEERKTSTSAIHVDNRFFVTNGDKDISLASSTTSSTKQIKLTVSDDARPTFTDTSDPNNTWTPGENLPTVTASDSGKFLRVSSTGAWEAEEGMILNSSTAGSTKKFKITVDDTGAISATEVTT